MPCPAGCYGHAVRQETGANKHVPRSHMVDLEPAVLTRSAPFHTACSHHCLIHALFALQGAAARSTKPLAAATTPSSAPSSTRPAATASASSPTTAPGSRASSSSSTPSAAAPLRRLRPQAVDYAPSPSSASPHLPAPAGLHRGRRAEQLRALHPLPARAHRRRRVGEGMEEGEFPP
jgi:hypothetical protein